MQAEDNIIKQQIRYVTHEIRNQLSISGIYCEVIKKQLAKNNIKNEAIENALNCIQKSTGLIGNSLIDLKLLTNISLHQELINPLIEESIELAKTYIYDKNIKIITKLDCDISVLTDKNKLQGCIINLIKNATEAIEHEGTIKITTSVNDDYLKIFISNTGKPINKKERSKLFEDGFTTKQTGSGIGLYLSRENLKSLGGDLILTSSKNTEFEILLKI